MIAPKTAPLQDRLALWLAAMPRRRKALWVGLSVMIGPITATATILLLDSLDRLLTRA
jgi:hypothetical protein